VILEIGQQSIVYDDSEFDLDEFGNL